MGIQTDVVFLTVIGSSARPLAAHFSPSDFLTIIPSKIAAQRLRSTKRRRQPVNCPAKSKNQPND
jgi:hypothetical protein